MTVSGVGRRSVPFIDRMFSGRGAFLAGRGPPGAVVARRVEGRSRWTCRRDLAAQTPILRPAALRRRPALTEREADTIIRRTATLTRAGGDGSARSQRTGHPAVMSTPWPGPPAASTTPGGRPSTNAKVSSSNSPQHARRRGSNANSNAKSATRAATTGSTSSPANAERHLRLWLDHDTGMYQLHGGFDALHRDRHPQPPRPSDAHPVRRTTTRHLPERSIGEGRSPPRPGPGTAALRRHRRGPARRCRPRRRRLRLDGADRRTHPAPRTHADTGIDVDEPGVESPLTRSDASPASPTSRRRGRRQRGADTAGPHHPSREPAAAAGAAGHVFDLRDPGL